MTEPSLALQGTIRTRLVANDTVTSLVVPSAILDKNARPEVFPCIIIGEGTTEFADNYDRFYDRPSVDIHVWDKESGLTKVKDITGAIRSALTERPWHVDGFLCPSLRVTNARYLRDPSGEHSHVVITVNAILQQVAA